MICCFNMPHYLLITNTLSPTLFTIVYQQGKSVYSNTRHLSLSYTSTTNLLSLRTPIKQSAIRPSLKRLCMPSRRIQRTMQQPRKPPNIKQHHNRPHPTLNQRRHHLQRQRASHRRQIIFRSSSTELRHCFQKRRLRIARKGSRKIHTCIDHEVSRAEHECGYPRHGGDFLDVRKALERFDLGNEADVIIGSGDVVWIIGVERCGETRGENPRAEGAVAFGTYSRLSMFGP